MTSAPVIHRANFTTPRHPHSFRVEITSSLDEFAAHWPTTAGGSQAHCYPFQCADVLQVWCDTIGRSRGIEPIFATIFLANGTPALLLPLGIERVSGIRILRFLDCGVSDYNAPVVFPETAFMRFDKRHLWEQLRSCLPPFDLAVLEKMPETIEGLPNPLSVIATARHPESCHGIALHGSADDFERKHLPNARDSRRRLRKLESRASIRFQIARTDKERKRYFDAMVRMKRQRFADTAANDIFADAGYWQFYAEATRRLGAAGAVQLSALIADDQIIAANWGFASGDRYYDLVPSYESGEWRTYAPGRLLTEWLLRQHLERGDRIFDYGIGDEPYKFDYCNLHTPLMDAYIPVTVTGSAYNRLLQLRLAAKSRLRDTRLGGVLKAARSLLGKLGRGRPMPAGETMPAWIALLGSVSLAVDA